MIVFIRNGPSRAEEKAPPRNPRQGVKTYIMIQLYPDSRTQTPRTVKYWIYSLQFLQFISHMWELFPAMANKTVHIYGPYTCNVILFKSVHTQPKTVVLQNQTQKAKLYTCQPECKISTSQSKHKLRLMTWLTLFSFGPVQLFLFNNQTKAPTKFCILVWVTSLKTQLTQLFDHAILIKIKTSNFHLYQWMNYFI